MKLSVVLNINIDIRKLELQPDEEQENSYSDSGVEDSNTPKEKPKRGRKPQKKYQMKVVMMILIFLMLKNCKRLCLNYQIIGQALI